MDEKRKAIRRLIKSMPKQEAINFVKSCGLRDVEEKVIIECDINGRTNVSVSMSMFVSPETVYNYKKSAYRRICRSLKGDITESNC